MKKIYSLLILCCLPVFLFAHQNREEQWREYIDGTVGKPLYYLYKDVMKTCFSPNASHRAIDLGSGAGNEVIDLLSQHWQVLAIDSSPRSGEVITQRAMRFKNNFQFQVGDFSKLILNGHYDLVMSFSALPFGNKKNLPDIMQMLSSHMQSGAVLAVNFFGEQHDFVKAGLAYGVSQADIDNILKQQHFNVIYFLNRIYNQRDFSGHQVHWDVFDVIALKQ